MKEKQDDYLKKLAAGEIIGSPSPGKAVKFDESTMMMSVTSSSLDGSFKAFAQENNTATSFMQRQINEIADEILYNTQGKKKIPSNPFLDEMEPESPLSFAKKLPKIERVDPG
jgi:hypothetical protein